MGIQQIFQSRRTSHSSSSLAGEIMSPMILVSFKEPIHLLRSTVGVDGTISATGLPWRVTRMGSRVLRTCSRRARHLALNSEMETSIMASPFDHIIDYGQNNGQINSAGKIREPRSFPPAFSWGNCDSVVELDR